MRQSFLISLIFFVCFPCISDISGTHNAYARRTDVISNLDLKDSTTALYHHIWPEREGMRKVVKLYQLLDRIIPQYGYIDSSGKEIVPCKFLYATDFENGYAVVGNKIRKSKYEHNRMDYWFVDTTGTISKSSFDLAVVPDSSGIAIVGKLDGVYFEYCHPEYFSMHYRYLHSKELLHIELTDYNQFPYTYVSKFENGLARVSKSSWRNPNESDWYIDESFNISDRNHNTAQSFLEKKWGDWVFRDVQLGPFKIIADNSEVVVFNDITNKRVTPHILNYHKLQESLNPDFVIEQFDNGMMGVTDFNNWITCAFDLLFLTSAHKGYIEIYSYATKKYGLLDLKGNIIIEANKYDTLNPCSKDYIIYSKGKQKGILNKQGQEVLNSDEYKFLNQIQQKEWFVFSYRDSDLRGIISLNGEILLYPKFERIGSNMNALLAVKNNGKWGFIDNDMQLKIPCQYDDVLHAFTEYGVALVKRDDLVEVINTNGEREPNEMLRDRIITEQQNIEKRNRRLNIRSDY